MARCALVGVASLASIGVVPATLAAQPYVEGGETRHRFAQTTVGTDARVFSVGDATAAGALQDARLIIGGTHFWGHADFFIAVPVGWSGETGFRTRVETGARYYPWRVERNKLRPYVGASVMGTTYQETGGPSQTRLHVPVTAGLTYQRGDYLVSLNLGALRHESSYFTSRFAQVPIRMHPTWVGIGVTRSFDTTLGAERGWLNGDTEARTVRALVDGSLDAWTVSAGASSAFFTRRSSELTAVGYAGQHEVVDVFPEVGVGRYFGERDAQVNLSVRRIVSEVSGHGFQQTATRTAITAEWYYFLFDWNGFVPFIGPNIGQEWLAVSGSTSGERSVTGVGATFGWDIRPDLLQAFTLRTTIRWMPQRNLVTGLGAGTLRSMSFDQLEVNFIQLVLYPGRIW